MKETQIDNHKVMYEDNADEGIHYLQRDLSDSEARVFFDQARNKGHVHFEDRSGRNFRLWHKDNGFVLERHSDGF